MRSSSDKRQKLLAQTAAVAESEVPHRPDRVDRLAALDLARSDGRVPAVVAVEVAQDRQTASTGASMIVLCRTLTMRRLAPEALLQRIEGRLEDAAADLLDQRRLALGRAVEIGLPLGEGGVAVGDRRQRQGGDVVLDAIGLSRIA